MELCTARVATVVSTFSSNVAYRYGMELCTARVATVCPVGRQRAVGCGPASEGGGELLAAPACSLHLD